MTTTVKSRPRAAAAADMDGGDRVADVFAVFGIVGVAAGAHVTRLAGACRFGTDLASFGFNRDCRAHVLERLSAQPQMETANA